MPCAALISAVTRAHVRPSTVSIVASTWQGVSNRTPLGLPLAATYSSGAGSIDAVPPSNLPSGALSSEAAAIDDDAIDAMPDEAFPAGARRTPGPAETMSAESARRQPGVEQDYPHADQARKEGRTAAADPYGPNDASSQVAHPPEPLQEPLYQPTDLTRTGEEEPTHPSLPDKEPEGTHLS